MRIRNKNTGAEYTSATLIKQGLSFADPIDAKLPFFTFAEGWEEVKAPEFKDGDILVLKNRRKCVFVFKKGGYSTSFYVGVFSSGDINTSGTGAMSSNDDVDFATEAEKQRLFDALSKEGKRWNPDNKCVEDLPYQPKDKELVWAWDDEDTSIKTLGFYDAIHEVMYVYSGERYGGSYDNYAPFEGEWPEWAKEAFKKLED